MFNSLSSFYSSSQWADFRRNFIAERLKRDGEIRCEYSGKVIVDSFDIVLHHKTYLTAQNVNDYSVSLNPENIMIVTRKAHNEIHDRFANANAPKKVFYVYGAPCSGKTTFVNNIKGKNDIVVDMDLIWQCITGDEYRKPPALNSNAFAIRDLLYDQIKKRVGKWNNAFIITGGAIKGARIREIEQFGAEPIYIDTPKEECLKRLKNAHEKDITAWTQYIETWFNDYTE